MRKKNRVMAWTALAMTVALFSGCGGGSNAPKTAEGDASAKTAAGPVDIEAAEISWGTSLPADDFIKKALDEKVGINLKLTLVGDQNDYENQMNVRAASGNLPDLLLATSKAHLQKLAQSGSLLDLTPYLDKLPEYTKFIGDEVLKKGILDGKQYALPKTGQPVSYTYWIRKDWLDNLQLQPPATVDELLEVAKAFTTNDPDKNGKNDTFGLTGTNFQTFDPIFGAYGLTNIFDTSQLYVRDGKVVSTFYQPEMKEVLTTIKSFLDAGVVDPEIVSNKGTMAIDKAFQGKVGIINTEWAQIMKDDKVAVWKGANPKAEWIQLAPPKGPTGIANANSLNIGASSGLWVIPKKLESEPEKLNKVLELLNYVSTTEGNRLVQYGVENTHYTLDGDTVKITDKGRSDASFTWLYQFTGRPETDYLKSKFSNLAAYIDFEANLPRIQTLDGFVTSPPGYNPADANRFIEEEMIKFVYGKAKIDNYGKFLETLEGTFSYKNYLDTAVSQLNELGYGK
ncbi:extracellular solute-binding protein [Paenibacillus jilunlii]|uniref:Carbohydrate ABC transporter substrate-binding protein, CUT1 family n=2 Tax=Paenibacillus jilunlii TaxID=682956 RepID=A0A1G9II89_9BACL|nr:extracellular solute-binding protein [Paenibacillus jilunlii]SDL24792.1 carbohydrate ABC transporter substrate-binding protein, CUT1 family [Paenibacillus jilunlii]